MHCRGLPSREKNVNRIFFQIMEFHVKQSRLHWCLIRCLLQIFAWCYLFFAALFWLQINEHRRHIFGGEVCAFLFFVIFFSLDERFVCTKWNLWFILKGLNNILQVMQVGYFTVNCFTEGPRNVRTFNFNAILNSARSPLMF